MVFYASLIFSLLISFAVSQGADHPGPEVKELESTSSLRHLSDQRHATVIYFLLFGTETLVGATPETIEKTNDYVIRFSQLWPLPFLLHQPIYSLK